MSRLKRDKIPIVRNPIDSYFSVSKQSDASCHFADAAAVESKIVTEDQGKFRVSNLGDADVPYAASAAVASESAAADHVDVLSVAAAPPSPPSVSDVYRLLASEQMSAIHNILRLGESSSLDAATQAMLDGLRRRYEETEAAYEAAMLAEHEANRLATVQQHELQQQQKQKQYQQQQQQKQQQQQQQQQQPKVEIKNDVPQVKAVGVPRGLRSKYADKCHHSGSEVSSGGSAETGVNDESSSDKSDFIDDSTPISKESKKCVKKYLVRFTGKKGLRKVPKKSKVSEPEPAVRKRRIVINDSD